MEKPQNIRFMIPSFMLPPQDKDKIRQGIDQTRQGIQTLGICFERKVLYFVVSETSFFAIKNPLQARNKGTAQLSICLTNKEKSLPVLKVCIPTTIIMATPLSNSKYGFRSVVLFIIKSNLNFGKAKIRKYDILSNSPLAFLRFNSLKSDFNFLKRRFRKLILCSVSANHRLDLLYSKKEKSVAFFATDFIDICLV